MNLKNFFPKKVYHCSCLNSVIISCLLDGIYSLGDICKEINQFKTNLMKIYCVKCGDNNEDVVFSCTQHMAIVIFSVKMHAPEKLPDKATDDCNIELTDETKTYFAKCVKKYLQKMYYHYHCTNFDLPMATK